MSAARTALVVGGGSGHYPAFAGLVGPGLATAAVLGNIFASPSARQVVDVGSAADQGHGVLFVYGNYAGDVMNFEMAAEEGRDLDAVARGVEDYYLEGEAPGRWLGAGTALAAGDFLVVPG